MKRIHKETFKQSACDGIPAHWVVQYWREGWAEASYHETLEQALEFEKELLAE